MILSKKTIRTLAQAVFAVLVFAVNCSLLTVNCFAQGGSQHYTSPLYSPKNYESDKAAVGSNGIPQVLKQVGIEQKLGSQLPLDAQFVDENGQPVTLGKYFGSKPVIIAFVYYECPMLCNEVLNGLVGSLKGITFTPGKEYEVVAISIEPKDTPELARAKKESYLARFNRSEAKAGFHLLTGSPESIKSATEAAGFNYQWDEKTKQYAHAGGIMVATPEGKLSHYFYGVEYAPKEVRLGLIEASDNKIGNPVDQLMLYCYHYDPATGTYGFMIMRAIRIAGVITLLGIAAMLTILWRYRGNNNRTGAKTA